MSGGLRDLIPEAPAALCAILDPEQGPVQPPIRAEIFGPDRFAQHGRSLGATHVAARIGVRTARFFPRLRDNVRVLRQAQRYIGVQASSGYDISPAAEWLMENFHLVESQLKEIHEGLPRSYFLTLPALVEEPLAGLPRIYGVAWAFVAHTDGAFDDELLAGFLSAYQESCELKLSEMWALPTTLRVVLIENLRRMAERLACHKAARELANLCCDRVGPTGVVQMDQTLALLDRRGVGRVFLAQIAQRLHDRRTTGALQLQAWVDSVLPDSAALLVQRSVEQAADNLSVSNAVQSLRAIGDADWSQIIARVSALMRLMLASPLFEAETDGTRDLSLHGIEFMARRTGLGELAIARTLLALMRSAPDQRGAAATASYWLHDAGRADLARALGLPDSGIRDWRPALRRIALPAYLAVLLLGTAALLAWLLHHAGAGQGWTASGWLTLCAAALMMLPASEVVVAVINRLISESARPAQLPRLALAQGVAPEHRVMVVIPAMLVDEASIDALVHRLSLHQLANPEPQAQFALVSDWGDADAAQVPGDDALLARARAGIRELNRRVPAPAGQAPRFLLLHRQRQFSVSEQRWIGWERKRGKLEQLVAELAQGAGGAFLDLADESRIDPQVRYLLTLDSDTELPPGRLRALVGVAAHPRNRPVLDASGRNVVSGYGILQPRIVTPLPQAGQSTPFHWLFAGRCGIDPYSAASSEVYQDIFAQGTFTGKGLLDVATVFAVLDRRLPAESVLSHDLLEGSIARCAAVTDVALIEEAPFHADVAASRVHRWTRGDWQLLPFLLQPGRYRLAPINRWKMFDNLRRSLVAPASVALLMLSLVTGVPSPWHALALVIAAQLAGPMIGAVAGLVPGRADLAPLHFFRQAGTDLLRALLSSLWYFGQLLAQALLSVDAIGRALYRLLVSRRHLLEWTTAAAAQATARTRLVELARRHWSLPLAALCLGTLLLSLSASARAHAAMTVAICLAWGLSPVWVWLVSRSPVAPVMPAQQASYLHGIARDTWRLFERCVVAADHHLPPDNLQTFPHDMVAHRTSPTNIGLYLLATVCARRFGWIGSVEMIERLQATLDTLAGLQRHRGHLLNWYDTQTCAPLLPMYVSTVDSGNLSGHLLAVAQACRELAPASLADAALGEGLRRSCGRIAPLRAQLPAPHRDGALARLLDLPDPVLTCRLDPGAFQLLLAAAADELDCLAVPAAEPELVRDPPQAPANAPASAEQMLAWLLADHLATLRSVARDQRENSGAQACARLLALAARCEAMAWQPDFGFLYHPGRHLFHIGYRVEEQQLDASFYDLLASESRLTSLLAIAKGDVPVRHWASLGRPFYTVGTLAGLRSWSGSMFEYLMPSLVIDERPGSVLRDACVAALREQRGFGRTHGVPWGISESAYAGSDHTLAYQYAPQGVPRLALRRTPPSELVVAPYATALAAQLDAGCASANFAALEALGGRDRYGFIEALDFSPARRTGTAQFTPVFTFMAHHQGMSIAALANVLLDGAVCRWGMTNPHVEAVASLLQERAPREVSALSAPDAELPMHAIRQRAPGMRRDVAPGENAVEPTQLLSNGRYSVSLRPNGAGTSRWGQQDITRWRDDALRDACGSFFYLRTARRPTPVSITQHPAPDPRAHYQSTFHGDRVCFDARWPHLQAHVTAWVSPEDDIEFRQVELCNLTDSEIEIELISTFEVVLTDARADEAHPAFTNMFVTAGWRAASQALVFERRPRLAQEPGLSVAHFLTGIDAQVLGIAVQTDRQAWRGRNRATSQPLARLDPSPADPGAVLDTGLDPVCVLAVRLRIAAQGKAQLTFATAAGDDAATLNAVIDKYRQRSHVQRASLMSATLSGIRLRTLGISAENFAAAQSLTTALVMSLTRPTAGQQPLPAGELVVCDRRLLWRFGISGDRPLLLVTAGSMQALGLLRSLVQALRLWSWGGIGCDLVVVNNEPASYQMALQREIAALRERHQADVSAQAGPSAVGLYLLRADEMSTAESSTLSCLARVAIFADGRPLLHHVQAWIERHEQAFETRHETSTADLRLSVGPPTAAAAPVGQFDAGSGEFRFTVSAASRPVRPWINVLANRVFGTQVSEAGGGYSWAVNSRLNQLTAWSNDPVADPPSEWFMLQDRRNSQVWSLAPSAWCDETLDYRVSHGQGYTTISFVRDDLEVTTSWCVDVELGVKQVSVSVTNRGQRTRHLRLVGVAEWMMGGNRADRATVSTFTDRQPQSLALLCTQPELSGGFGGGTAFLSVDSASADGEDWTCDRRELFDARGWPVLPDHLGQRAGAGLDPCAALSVRLSLPAGESTERLFLLGYAGDARAAVDLARQARRVGAAQRVLRVRASWDRLLGATTVITPDPLFDAMVNRWLLYQTVSSRIWAKAGFYQAGGATGFRDQLQDAMALAWAAPSMLREQIVACASRQFVEGDVQHWWHLPTGAGVRTRFSDDLLWLAHACVVYLQATDDGSLLDESVPFLDGQAIPAHQEDAYFVPACSAQQASVYEHAARAIDRSLQVGVHGLPLMGSGDWNDGMNLVGRDGRGESVWLGWFLWRLVTDFAPLARARGDDARAARWEDAARGWQQALNDAGWDGDWYRRAFFDDGQALGSAANAEARIDLIAQAWAVLSGAAPLPRQRQAMAAVSTHLADHRAGLLRLLDPPLVHAVPSAGYIQAYPPGVRENGGQYSHAAVWALMAQARLATLPGADGHEADPVYRYFTWLSPAHRAARPALDHAYGIEPYVMAGDVYTQPPYRGRGGWSWYTGAAAWMHRAAISSIFGLQQQAGQLWFVPCLPSHWMRAELTLQRDDCSLRFILCRATPAAALAATVQWQSRLLLPGQRLDWRAEPPGSCFVVPMAMAPDELPDLPEPGDRPAVSRS